MVGYLESYWVREQARLVADLAGTTGRGPEKNISVEYQPLGQERQRTAAHDLEGKT